MTAFVLAVAMAAVLFLPGTALAGPVLQVTRDGDTTGELRQPPAKTFESDHQKRVEQQRRSDALSAQVMVPCTIDAQVIYPSGGSWWMDGYVTLPGGSPTNIGGTNVTVEYHNASDVQVDSAQVFAKAWVLIPGMGTPFTCPLFDPGTGHFTATSAGGWATALAPVFPMIAAGPGGTGPSGEVWQDFTITNDKSYPVVGAQAVAYEAYSPTGTPPYTFWDTMEEDPHQGRLAPGEAIIVTVWGYRLSRSPGQTWSIFVGSDALRAPATQPVFRFYNRRTGTHFYTIDPAEKTNVLTTLSAIYQYDGEAYSAHNSDEVNTIPLYRFYNRRTGTHFYTADPDERDGVIATLGAIYQYEGEVLWVADGGGDATNLMYRFYNRRTGTHFYTIDPAERDRVIATMSAIYQFDGAAYNVPKYVAPW